MKFGKMKPHRRNQLLIVAFVLLGSGGAIGLALSALNENINLFYDPVQIATGEAPVGQVIRAGGMVKAGSVKRSESDLKVNFVITDMKSAEVPIQYEGILPDLFREGQGVIARGQLDESGMFMAEEVLAKHDENYMPPEVKAALAKAHEQDEAGAGASAGESPGESAGEEIL